MRRKHKILKKIILFFIFFNTCILKNSWKIKTTFHQYQKLYSTPHDMVHIAAKFRENTSMRFRVTVRKLNGTDGRTDKTDRQMDGRTDEGHCNISRARAYSVAGDNNHILVVLGSCIHVSVRHILCWCTWIVFPCKMCICKYFCNIFFLNLRQSQYWPHLAFRTNVHKGVLEHHQPCLFLKTMSWYKEIPCIIIIHLSRFYSLCQSSMDIQ